MLGIFHGYVTNNQMAMFDYQSVDGKNHPGIPSHEILMDSRFFGIPMTWVKK